jgi:hypothetical protein
MDLLKIVTRRRECIQIEEELVRSALDYVEEDRQAVTAPEFLRTEKRDWPIAADK